MPGFVRWSHDQIKTAAKGEGGAGTFGADSELSRNARQSAATATLRKTGEGRVFAV